MLATSGEPSYETAFAKRTQIYFNLLAGLFRFSQTLRS